MKKIFLLVCSIVIFVSTKAQVHSVLEAKRIIAQDSLKVNGKWHKSFTIQDILNYGNNLTRNDTIKLGNTNLKYIQDTYQGFEIERNVNTVGSARTALTVTTKQTDQALYDGFGTLIDFYARDNTNKYYPSAFIGTERKGNDSTYTFGIWNLKNKVFEKNITADENGIFQYTFNKAGLFSNLSIPHKGYVDSLSAVNVKYSDSTIYSTKANVKKTADSLSSIFNTSLGNYLPLSGGTLTGALNGTSAAFSGEINIQNGLWRFANNGIFYWGFDRGYLTWDSGEAALRSTSGNILKLGTAFGEQIIMDESGNTFIANAMAQKHTSDTRYSGWVANTNGEYSLYTASSTTFLTGGEKAIMIETAPGGDMLLNKNVNIANSLSVVGQITTQSIIQTAQPSANGAGLWKLGKYKVAAASLNADAYIEVDIDGTIYKLLIGN